MIYFIEQEGQAKRVKIGYSDDPKKRLEQLQTGNAAKLSFLDVSRVSYSMYQPAILEGDKCVERYLHGVYAELRVDRSEWFSRTEQLDQAIKNFCARRSSLKCLWPLVLKIAALQVTHPEQAHAIHRFVMDDEPAAFYANWSSDIYPGAKNIHWEGYDAARLQLFISMLWSPPSDWNSLPSVHKIIYPGKHEHEHETRLVE